MNAFTVHYDGTKEAQTLTLLFPKMIGKIYVA
jgi:hypothetical protein